MKKAAKKAGIPETVPEYIAMQPKEAQTLLRQMRAAVRAGAPKAEEKISYRMPYYKHHGMLIAFGAAKKHIGLYSLSNTFLKRHGKEAEKYQTSVGTLQFPLDKKLPTALITKLVRARAKENETKKMKGT